MKLVDWMASHIVVVQEYFLLDAHLEIYIQMMPGFIALFALSQHSFESGYIFYQQTLDTSTVNKQLENRI